MKLLSAQEVVTDWSGRVCLLGQFFNCRWILDRIKTDCGNVGRIRW